MPLIFVLSFPIAFFAVVHYPDDFRDTKELTDDLGVPSEARAGEWQHTVFYAKHGSTDRSLFFILPDETAGCTATTSEEFHAANLHHGESWRPTRIIDRRETDYSINIAGNMVMANADWVDQLSKLDATIATHEKGKFLVRPGIVQRMLRKNVLGTHVSG